MVVQLDITGNGALEVFAAGELVTSQHLFDAVVEVLDHAVGLRAPRAGEAMLDAQRLAQLIKLMPAAFAARSAIAIGRQGAASGATESIVAAGAPLPRRSAGRDELQAQGPPASLAVGAVENRRPQPGSPEHPPMPLARFAWHGVCLRLSRRHACFAPHPAIGVSVHEASRWNPGDHRPHQPRSRKPCLRTFSVQARRQAASELDADDLLSDPGVVT
jgi:hypothetical protein